MKKAICQVADTGPLESLAVMLGSAGYQCLLPDDDLKGIIRGLGCDTVVDVEGLVANWGYEHPFPLSLAAAQDMETADLYVDIKAHRNGPKVWGRWPRLKDKTLWYRINGTKPEITPRGGDEINLVCPILTPNIWHAEKGPWSERAYACWPPFYRFDEYYPRFGRVDGEYDSPLCLVHNLQGWGYGALAESMRRLGVKLYGAGSPDGLVQHADIPKMLSRVVAMVHLKSSDAPGYALYEALAAACPLIVTRRLIWRNRMQDLFEPGKTCLVFDRETHEGLSPQDVAKCTREVREGLQQLQDPAENQRIGMAGRERLQEIMWNKRRNGSSLKSFMERMYGTS